MKISINKNLKIGLFLLTPLAFVAIGCKGSDFKSTNTKESEKNPIVQPVETEPKKFTLFFESGKGEIEMNAELRNDGENPNKVPNYVHFCYPEMSSESEAEKQTPINDYLSNIRIKFESKTVSVDFTKVILYDMVGSIYVSVRGFPKDTGVPSIGCAISEDKKRIALSISGGDGEGSYFTGFVIDLSGPVQKYEVYLKEDSELRPNDKELDEYASKYLDKKYRTPFKVLSDQ